MNHTDTKGVLTLEEASQLFQVSTKTFLKLLREEDIPARKVGREWRFSRTALLNWIESGNSRSYTSVEEENHAYFDQLAPVYDELRKNCYGNAFRDILISRFAPKVGSQVADIGTGTGYLAKVLAKYAAKVIAVDSSTAMLEVAANDLIKSGLNNTEFVVGDAHDLPLDDASQDMVYANLLLHHLLEPAIAIKEMVRILKPGGQIVLTDVKRHNYQWVKQEKFDLWLGFEKKEVELWYEKARLIHIEVSDFECNCQTSNSAGETIEIPMFLAVGTKP